MSEKLLEIKNLHTSFFTHVGEVKAVRDVSFQLSKGEVLGIVGESGSGKSVTALSIMRLLQYPGKIVSGSIHFNGEDLANKSLKQMRKIRGNHISMIFQDPMTSLNPLFTIGNQLVEAITEHRQMSKAKAHEHAINMLKTVGIPSAKERMKNYPYEFSGGMRQRAMIAMSLSCRPQLLIADEPTTALDVTIQAQILKLIKDLNIQLNMSTILITHDLACVASTCDRVIVMYGGQIMEEGTDEEIFYSPNHPYTMGLLQSVPKITGKDSKERLIPIPGSPPDMLKLPVGCPFYPRCRYAMKICEVKEVPYTEISPGHRIKCWLCHKAAPEILHYEEHKRGLRAYG